MWAGKLSLAAAAALEGTAGRTLIITLDDGGFRLADLADIPARTRVPSGARKPCARFPCRKHSFQEWPPSCSLQAHRTRPLVELNAAMKRVLEVWLQPDLAVAAACGGSAAARLPDPVSDSLGLFLVLIVVELVASWQIQRAGGKQQYNLRQSISNLSAGILSVLVGEAGWVSTGQELWSLKSLNQCDMPGLLLKQTILIDCQVTLVTQALRGFS